VASTDQPHGAVALREPAVRGVMWHVAVLKTVELIDPVPASIG
jgi:hypothetical protein